MQRSAVYCRSFQGGQIFNSIRRSVYWKRERKWLQFLNKQMDVYFHTWLDVCPNLRSAPLKLQWICHEGQHIWLLYVSWICRKQKGERGRCKITFRRRAKQVENAKKSAQQQQHNNNKQAKLLCAGRRPRHLFYFLPLKKKPVETNPPQKKMKKFIRKKPKKINWTQQSIPPCWFSGPQVYPLAAPRRHGWQRSAAQCSTAGRQAKKKRWDPVSHVDRTLSIMFLVTTLRCGAGTTTTTTKQTRTLIFSGISRQAFRLWWPWHHATRDELEKRRKEYHCPSQAQAAMLFFFLSDGAAGRHCLCWRFRCKGADAKNRLESLEYSESFRMFTVFAMIQCWFKTNTRHLAANRLWW